MRVVFKEYAKEDRKEREMEDTYCKGCFYNKGYKGHRCTHPSEYTECLGGIFVEVVPISAKDLLLPALRKHRHNSRSEELIQAYDYEETQKIVQKLLDELANVR